MRLVVVSLVLAALVGCNRAAQGDAPPDSPPPWTDDMQSVADGGNRFALDLYGKLREEKGNLFLSPYSVHAALAMTATGAKSTTRDEMVKVLHLPADEGKILAAGDLGRYYAHPRTDYELSVANALWGQGGFPWRPEWLAAQRERFGAGFHEADFEKDKSGAIAQINRWVDEQTRGKIRDILKPDDVPVYERAQLTRMVLTNAIYFKGQWTEEFKKSTTHDAPFHLAGGGSVPVPLMSRTGEYRYADLGNFQALEMPYRGGDLSMVVLLPRKPDGLPELEKRFTADNWTTWLGKLMSAEVQVSIPRFKLEQRFEPDVHLKALGLTAAYDPKVSDFSGMTTLANPELFISKVIHQAFVDVNEEGTEAAAATAVVVAQPASARAPARVFRADRPFLFLIRDTKHGTILFLGRVTNPKG
jgi:serpin B